MVETIKQRVCCVLFANQHLLLLVDAVLDTLGICPW